jgi:competence protein ComEC
MLFTAPGAPTQRSWLMTGIVLFAVVIDRTAITMRLVAWAAFVVLLMFPESMMGPSFQMSFGAVIALIALWEGMRDRLAAWRDGRGWLGRAAVSLAGATLTSLVAGLATAPFALYHFNRFTGYGLAANMLAVPLTGIWIMPWVVVAFVLLPFGLEYWALVPMAWGIEAMLWIGRTVAGWSGAVALLPAMPGWALAVVALAGLWLCIWQNRWRWLGAPLIVLGCATVVFTRGPDVLIAGDARLIAVRGADGGLAFSTAGRPNTNSLVRETWLRRDGLESATVWPTSGVSDDGRLACDPRGCVYTARAQVVAIARRAEALADDCRYATVLITTFNLRRPCAAPALAIDRAALVRDGGYAVWLDRSGGSAVAESVRASRGERPWVLRAPAPPRAQPSAVPPAQPARVPPRPLDPADDAADD